MWCARLAHHIVIPSEAEESLLAPRISAIVGTTLPLSLREIPRQARNDDVVGSGYLRETVGIGRGVAALEADLVRALVAEVEEEVLVEGHSPVLRRVQLHHPALDAVRIELGVPGEVERVRDVDASPVAADLDHLRSAVERAGRRRVPVTAHDAADPDRTGLLGVEGVRHVVLLQLTGA